MSASAEYRPVAPGPAPRGGELAVPFPRLLSRRLRGSVNRATLHLAGHLAFADLEHVGRRTGTVRHTPLRAFRTGDTVVVGINFGRESDWLRNIRAAGGGRIRLGGQWLELGAPRIVPVTEGVRGMPWLFGAALRYVVRTKECVELPVLGEGSGSPP
ncbi:MULTISPECIES: nitroreductase family deazaflavin-dependent oxidoreductase [Streptomyces]|uniref:Nitroreductase family deazaflavin-dependent oxidoreductase n=1 Tax=Streptomyces gilvifuscus TaxID=1550617 RepID=A0ABT5FR22_9ACTN|nr:MULTISPECIES: nitroreductase family deazaflavin-dependent oxidoreductase [Streptomyces]MBK3643213.1 nitroreductase family deazaflavin-dependent oxidoreductase [Streptomyces sp. MBT33]MDC2954985.1 nitroreductase family deazaflavin-dependent oxidoreductase [Streptomyces gilvifuscus]